VLHLRVEPNRLGVSFYKIGGLLVRNLRRGDVREFIDKLKDGGMSRSMSKKALASLRSTLHEALEPQ